MGWPLPLDVTVRVIEEVFRDGFDTTLPEIHSVGSVCVLFSEAIALCVVDTMVITASTFWAKHLRYRPLRARKLYFNAGYFGKQEEEWEQTMVLGVTLTCDHLIAQMNISPYNDSAIKFMQRNILVTRSVHIYTQTSNTTRSVLRGMRVQPAVHEVVVAGNSSFFAWRPTNSVVRELTVVFPNATTVAIGALLMFEKSRESLFMTIGTVLVDRPGVLCAAQLEEAIRKWPRLQRLAISGGSLTSVHLLRIAAACIGLLELSISRCPEIDAAAVTDAFDARPSLHFMDLSGVGITTSEGELLVATTGRKLFVV